MVLDTVCSPGCTFVVDLLRPVHVVIPDTGLLTLLYLIYLDPCLIPDTGLLLSVNLVVSDLS